MCAFNNAKMEQATFIIGRGAGGGAVLVVRQTWMTGL